MSPRELEIDSGFLIIRHQVLRAKVNVLNLPRYLGVSIIALPRPLKKIYTTARRLVSNFKHIDIPVGSSQFLCKGPSSWVVSMPMMTFLLLSGLTINWNRSHI